LALGTKVVGATYDILRGINRNL